MPIAALGIWLIIVRGSYRSRRAGLHLVDDSLLRLPDRGDPRPSRLGPGGPRAGRAADRRPTRPTCCCSWRPRARRSPPTCSSTCSRRWSSEGRPRTSCKAEGSEAVAGALFANLIAAFVIIATGGDPLRRRRPHDRLRRRGGEGAGAAGGPVRGAALRHRPPGRQSAGRGDPADRHLLRALGVTRL